MVTFPANKASTPQPAIHSQGSAPNGTTHIAVRVQAGFAPAVAPVFPPTNECLLALDRFLAQFKGKPNLEGLICALADRGQPILNALEDTKAFRSLDTATGQQLDELGKFYNEPRVGKTDDQYRAFLKAFAVIIGSKGTGNENLDALVFLDNGFALSAISLVPHFPAAYIMTAQVPFGQQLLGEEFARVLRKIRPAGVQFILLFQYPSSVTHFVWSGETGEGFAEEDDLVGTGGFWAEGV